LICKSAWTLSDGDTKPFLCVGGATAVRRTPSSDSETFLRFAEAADGDIASTSTTSHLSSASFRTSSTSLTSLRESPKCSLARSTFFLAFSLFLIAMSSIVRMEFSISRAESITNIADDARALAAARRCFKALISCFPSASMIRSTVMIDIDCSYRRICFLIFCTATHRGG